MERASRAPVGGRLEIARHLTRLRNFRTAAHLLTEVATDQLSLIDQCFVGVTLLSARSGRIADEQLAPTSSASGTVRSARRRL